nr:3-oxoacyl-(acyl carrier protein) synthase III [uncultured bacterium]
MPAYLTHLAAFLPHQPVPSQRIESVLGMIANAPSAVKDLILERNGIKWRYYAIDPATGRATHTNAELTAEAIRRLLDETGLPAESIDLLACGTSSPDQLAPSHAAMVHGVLRCPPCEIVSMAGVCCSSMGALRYAQNSVLTGSTERAVVTGSELASAALKASQYEHHNGASAVANPYVGFSQEFLRFMLSDGAGAALVESQPRPGSLALRIDWLEMRSYANEIEACMYSGATKEADGSLRGFRMEPGGVDEAVRKGYFNLSQDVSVLGEKMVKIAARYFTEVYRRHDLDASAIDWILPHLSSYFFQQPIYEEMAKYGWSVSPERWFTNLKYKGNTGAASIFIMLEELFKSGKLKAGQRILCMVPESARFTFACMHLTVVA